MFKEAVESIKSLGTFSAQELILFASKLQFHECKKNEWLVARDQTCNAFYYLKQGSCKHYYLDEDGTEIILNLYLSNIWLTEFDSFTSQRPSQNYIKAFEDCQIVQLPLCALHELMLTCPSFYQLGKLMESMKYPNFSGSHRSPGATFERLLSDKPGLILKFPLKDIASLLRLAPETISRIRSKITHS